MVLLLGLPEWVVLAVTVGVLWYLYATRTRNYWKNQNVPSEPLSLIFGPSLQLLYKPIHAIDAARYNKYGRFFGACKLPLRSSGRPHCSAPTLPCRSGSRGGQRQPPRSRGSWPTSRRRLPQSRKPLVFIKRAFESNKLILFVAEPELVKQVLVKDFPSLPNRRSFTFYDPLLDNMMSITPVERWRKIRPAASPAFSTGKLRKMNSLIEDCAMSTAEHLKKAASKKEDIDVKQFFGHYTLDVIARCAFATRLDSHSDQTNEFVTRTRQAFSGRITPRIFFFFLFPALAKMIRLRPFNSEIFLYFKRICQNIIKSRQDKQSHHEDFLQLMMDAQEGKLASASENATERDNQLFNLGSDVKLDTSFSSNKTLTEDESMAQCVLFFIAGQDTTSTVISFTLYLLAIHPEVQEKLREEVDECFKVHGEHPSLDVVTKLKYLHCVVSESLRMYPPATRIERSPYEDYVLGDTGVKIKKEELIAIPVYSMHYDPQYFPDPMKFDPERFSDENIDSIQPYTYLPFGAGPRNCIGMRFALQAVKLSILYTIRNVQVVRTQKTKVPLEFQNGFTVLTAKDLTLGIRQRG